MKELYIGLVSFLFGLLAHILYGVIAKSRAKKRVRQALSQEIQINFFQIRDGRNYSLSKKKELNTPGKNDTIVINHYDFNFGTYESNITDIPLLSKNLSLKIHHFYSRLKALQNTAITGLKLYEESKELYSKKEGLPITVKAIDASSVSSHLFQILDEYHQFESQAYNLGNELLEKLKYVKQVFPEKEAERGSGLNMPSGSSTENSLITEHPRIKRGPITVAHKDPKPGETSDMLIANSFFRTFLQTTPDYWEKLLDLLYRGGRLRLYASSVEDTVEKFSFLFLSREQIRRYEPLDNDNKRFYIKYFAYSFIYFTKSFLDSIAVFLNVILELNFKGGEIDLKKKNFVNAILSKHKELGEKILAQKTWIQKVVKYRDNLIHRHALYVGPCPTVPPDMTDEKEISRFILKEPYYLPNHPDLTTDKVSDQREGELIKLTCFVDEWIDQASQMFDIVMGTFATQFTRASWLKSKNSANGSNPTSDGENT